jgi:hypothetical protein
MSASDPQVSIVGPLTVQSKPAQNLVDGHPYTAVTVGLVESVDPGIAAEYDKSVNQAVNDSWSRLRQIHQDFQQTPRFKSLVNLEAQHRQALDQVTQLQQKVVAADQANQAKMAAGNFTLDDQNRLRKLQLDLDGAKMTLNSVTGALDQARTAYRTAVKAAVEEVRQKIITQADRDHQKAQAQLAGAVVANGIGLATAEAVQVRFGGLWREDDCFQVPNV